GRERPAPALGGIGLVALHPTEGDLVALEEAAQVGAGRVPSVADDDRPRRRWVGGDALEAVRSADPVAREAADLRRDLGRERRHRVVVVWLDPQHALRLSLSTAVRQYGAELT